MDALAPLLALAPFALLAFLLVPARVANRWAVVVRRVVTTLTGFQFVVAAVAALMRMSFGLGSQSEVLLELAPATGLSDAGLNLGIYYDGPSSLMLLMVSFVGWVICRYSMRYLDGDTQQGNYFRWAAATIGAVSLMAISGNLIMFAVAWVLTSFGLHHLLLYYPDRPGAQRAAWTKFAISRLGDVALLAALILTYVKFQTLDLAALFAALDGSLDTSAAGVPIGVIGWLFITAAALKSAQFPFHSWLPLTMETPTPVSALMHAGIVNAGGYLLIRMSPLVVHAPSAMTMLAIVGAVTAVFGGVVMMTQSSVKQALAYSTIAQMGFMMLQCGLGAFTAAMLHLVAHSLYKAHAFLNSGSVISQAASMKVAGPVGSQTDSANPPSSLGLLSVAAAVFLVYLSASSLLGFDFTKKPGAFVFTFTLCLALMTWGWRVLRSGTTPNVIGGLLSLAALCVIYMGGYMAVGAVLGGAVPTIVASSAALAVNAAIALAFGGLMALHFTINRQGQPRWLDALRVHASSGFYVDAICRRLFHSAAS